MVPKRLIRQYADVALKKELTAALMQNKHAGLLRVDISQGVYRHAHRYLAGTNVTLHFKIKGFNGK